MRCEPLQCAETQACTPEGTWALLAGGCACWEGRLRFAREEVACRMTGTAQATADTGPLHAWARVGLRGSARLARAGPLAS